MELISSSHLTLELLPPLLQSQHRQPRLEKRKRPRGRPLSFTSSVTTRRRNRIPTRTWGKKEIDNTLTDRTPTPPQTAKKTSWWRQLKRGRRVVPAAEVQGEEKKPQSREQRSLNAAFTVRQEQRESASRSPKDLSDLEELALIDDDQEFLELPNNSNQAQRVIRQEVQEELFSSSSSGAPTETNEQQETSSFSHQDEVVAFIPEPEDDLLELPTTNNATTAAATTNTSTTTTTYDDTTTTANQYGFPNLGESCYMNSSLQSLLTLGSFTRDLSLMEQVWSSNPDSQLMRVFTAIKDAHASEDWDWKTRLLCSFIDEVSVKAPEFCEDEQNDAHEFLTAVLDQMRGLSPLLQDTAACMGRTYTCPVEDHMKFSMENTRTCKRCGVHSKRQEVYSNLSLDLVPGGSVEDMLQNYMKETELDYRCECGGETSTLRTAFQTLPKVLVLHLKRFRLTSSFTRVKVHDPVELLRDLVVSSQQDGGCYSLVSAISHLGVSAENDGDHGSWMTMRTRMDEHHRRTKTPRSHEDQEVLRPTGGWAHAESLVPPKVSSSQREFFLATQSLDGSHWSPQQLHHVIEVVLCPSGAGLLSANRK